MIYASFDDDKQLRPDERYALYCLNVPHAADVEVLIFSELTALTTEISFQTLLGRWGQRSSQPNKFKVCATNLKFVYSVFILV